MILAVESMTKSYFFAKHRLLVSRVFAIILMGLLVISAPKLTSLYFIIPLDIVGFALLVTGALGRVWCSSYISGHKGGRLICQGPFSISRNPLYFFSFIAVLGIGLSTYSSVILVLLIVLYAIIYTSTIQSEEVILAQQFGTEYVAYKQRTPRLFPKWSLFSRDETSTISMASFDKSLLDVSLFFVVYGLIKLIMVIHRCNIVVPLFLIS